MSTTLPPDPTSAATARRFVSDALADQGHDAQIDIAEVLVSELVTNAILHARTKFTLDVVVNGDAVRICVTDGSAAHVQRRNYSEAATTGRGLALVEALASEWGSEPVDGGKRVWFELREPVMAA